MYYTRWSISSMARLCRVMHAIHCFVRKSTGPFTVHGDGGVEWSVHDFCNHTGSYSAVATVVASVVSC
jgi:hypothetical protein